jgi:chemotaxis methyl-accepting protein methylase
MDISPQRLRELSNQLGLRHLSITHSLHKNSAEPGDDLEELALNHHTDMHRYVHQSDFIADLVNQRSSQGLSTLIVSAPCSHALEICSIAERIFTNGQLLSEKKVKFLGLDVSTGILELGKEMLKDF